MFIITPKRPKRVQAGATSGAPDVAEEEDRGPVRSTTACDSCRIRKTKCNGQQPCSRCQRQRIICVYSRPTHRDTPVTPGHVSLLQHQQRRLCKAVQEMAAVIARYENGVDHAPSSFVVSDLLEKYAPSSVFDANMESEAIPLHPTTSIERSPSDECTSTSTKRGHEDESIRTRSPKRRRSIDIPFEIQPASSWVGEPEQQRQAYQAMVQFMQSMNTPIPTSNDAMGTLSSSSTSIPVGTGTSDLTPLQNVAYPGICVPQTAYAMPAPSFMDLVDWDSSLENVLLSIDPLANEPWTSPTSASVSTNPSNADMTNDMGFS